MRRLALAGLLLLAGCGDHAQPLQPIPAPQLPVTVKVPVLVQLPAGMTDPCADPPRRTVTTDVQLLEAADAWKVAKRCSDSKLRAIQAAQPKGVTP